MLGQRVRKGPLSPVGRANSAGALCPPHCGRAPQASLWQIRLIFRPPFDSFEAIGRLVSMALSDGVSNRKVKMSSSVQSEQSSPRRSVRRQWPNFRSQGYKHLAQAAASGRASFSVAPSVQQPGPALRSVSSCAADKPSSQLTTSAGLSPVRPTTQRNTHQDTPVPRGLTHAARTKGRSFFLRPSHTN